MYFMNYFISHTQTPYTYNNEYLLPEYICILVNNKQIPRHVSKGTDLYKRSQNKIRRQYKILNNIQMEMKKKKA